MLEHFVSGGNHGLFVEVSGSGQALVFAHGLNGTHADGAWVAAAASGFTLIKPDLRGRGRSSPARTVEEHAYEHYASDIATILDELKVSEAALCGTSFGAAVAVAFALRNPSRVRALLLIASAFGAKLDDMGEGDLTSYGKLGDRIAQEGVTAVAKAESERTGASHLLKRWSQHDEASLVAWLRAVPIYRPFARVAELRSLAVPTLVFPGQDEIHTRQLSESYAEALPKVTLADDGVSLESAALDFLGRLT